MEIALPLRNCLGCGQTDNHPRHVVALPGDQEMAWHMDCHSRMGCETCARQIAGSNGATGDALRTHIVNSAAQQGV